MAFLILRQVQISSHYSYGFFTAQNSIFHTNQLRAINNEWEQQFLFKSTENESFTRDIISVSDNGVIAVAYGISGKSLVKVFDLSDFISSNSYITEVESPLYPNPTDGILHIYIQEESNVNEVTIYDPSGRLIRSQLIKNGEIDITDLNSGTYILQVGTNIQRIIKE